ncbi:hypothetical protein A8990_104148 [Paenibacillus taihuensis]|uniref:Uncharacterized protein n=1 Tax=Paenibacillus taihuensis TaxID=1156355 RepID=A0A3D9SL40_9BACL|nr:hypothetical protein [Paenibacillus taihuensis]REE91640.1 hypothetical protein A8990_104148 [Paenibacillus taihuensis]
MEVPVGVWIAAALIAIVLTWITIWVTNKAYSRRWEDSSSDKFL